jgi:hypothetical protein
MFGKDSKKSRHKTTILPVVLYGCATMSLNLREEQRLMVSENRVLRRICGPKCEEVTIFCWRLHNEELHKLHVLRNVIRSNQVNENDMGTTRRKHGILKKCVQNFD